MKDLGLTKISPASDTVCLDKKEGEDFDTCVAMLFDAPDAVTLKWFSGKIPSVGKEYKLVATEVVSKDGRTSVSLNFVET